MMFRRNLKKLPSQYFVIAQNEYRHRSYLPNRRITARFICPSVVRPPRPRRLHAPSVNLVTEIMN